MNLISFGYFLVVLDRSTIKDKIIPHAVSWFTGEAVQEDSEDIEGEDDDEDEDDEEEEEEEEEIDEDDDDEDDDEEKTASHKSRPKKVIIFLLYFQTFSHPCSNGTSH